MSQDLDELAARLRERAQAATPGPWQSLEDGNQYIGAKYMPTVTLLPAAVIPQLVRPWNPHAYIAFGHDAKEHETVRLKSADAAYIAAASPDAVLRILDDREQMAAQIDRLARFILENVPGEPSQSQGAVDTAIRLLAASQQRAADAERELADFRAGVSDMEKAWERAVKERNELRERAVADDALIAQQHVDAMVYRDERDAARREAAALQAAVARYGWHLDDCTFLTGDKDGNLLPCSCGFAALAAARQPAETAAAGGE